MSGFAGLVRKMQTRDNDEPQKAMKHWPKAEWIMGNGNIALLAHCGVLTVTLWTDEEEAKNQKKFINRYVVAVNVERHLVTKSRG